MAVTRTLTQLAADLRLGDGTTMPDGQVGIVLARISATARALVAAYAPLAPDAISNEAFVRLAGYLYDSDPSGRTSNPDALKASGAASLLAPYRSKRGGLIATGEGAATPSAAAGVDQIARDAAVAARAVADSNAAKLMPPSNEEADNATATTIRGWTAALIRRVVESIVPAWARADNAPSVAVAAAVAANRTRIDGLADLTLDLHAGPTPTGWTDANSDAQGGMAFRTGGEWSLALARAESTWVRQRDAGGSPRFVVRIPAATDPRQVRVRFTDGQLVYEDGVNGLHYLGNSADNAWKYYAESQAIGEASNLQLQVTSSAAHVGQSVFRGMLGSGIVKLAALASAVADRLLPTGGGDGKFLGHADGSPAWVDAPAGGAGVTTQVIVARLEGTDRGLLSTDHVTIGSFDVPANRSLGIVGIGQFTGSGNIKLGYKLGAAAWDDTSFETEAVNAGGLFKQTSARFDGGSSGRTIQLRLQGDHASNRAGFFGLVTVFVGQT